MEANLLVTFEPTHKENAKAEIESLLKEAKQEGKILKAEEGLAELSVKDAKAVIKKLAAFRGKLTYSFNWWPVDAWCNAEIKDMQAAIKKLQEGIKKEEKWKMELAKRKTTKEYPSDIIIKLTEVVDKPNVDLKNPDKIIKVEIIGERAALSLLTKDEFLKKS